MYEMYDIILLTYNGARILMIISRGSRYVAVYMHFFLLFVRTTLLGTM
jgi:hypothetical protein